MSHKSNDLYLEGVMEEFLNTHSGDVRGRLIKELRENGMPDEADYLEHLREVERSDWLEMNSLTENDVLTDEEGREYVTYLMENGNPDEEGYGFIKQKTYLPEILILN